MEIRSGDALMVFDRDLEIVEWNAAAEELTGIRAEDAVGRPCWDVLHGTDERGGMVCHRGCSGARLMQKGWPVRAQMVQVATARGTRKPVTMSTVAILDGERPLFVHVLRNGAENPPKPDPDANAKLTARQTQVLQMLVEGLSAKRIATNLGLAEPTIRNHIRAILIALGAHSQLEALAKARKLGLVA